MRNKTNYEKVREFHKVFCITLDHPLTLDSLEDQETQELLLLREKLVREEFEELMDSGSIENFLKEMVDLLYVIYGTAATFGLDIDTAFNRVHESNMSKLGDDGKPVYREDRKVLKGPNYKAPDLSDLV